jgi:hypothetical protein
VNTGQKRCALWRFPPRSIFVERVDNEWHVLSTPGAGACEGPSSFEFIARVEKPRSSEWRHYLHTEEAPVQPAAVLPDRPVVVRPDRPLTLLPGQNALFFVEIPVWFRLSTAAGHPTRIFEEPLCVLSKTWFGDPVTGELCYGLATRLHQSIDSVEPYAFVAVCPIAITNDSETDLAFEKICLHVENLSVFRGPRRLWANRLNVIFKGPEQATQIEIVHAPPELERGLAVVSPARQPASGWNIRKTFGMLKYFADI